MTSGGPPVLRFPDVPKLELDQLIDQLVDRAEDVKRAQGRLRALLRAIESIGGDLSLEATLRRIVEEAADLAGAEYAALGVLDPEGGLVRFIHVGMPEEAVARIGHLPEGRGLLGALISDPRPIRLAHMSDDPRSVGFPEGHPPMDSFLGVPIGVRGEVFGNLYLANSLSGEFTAEDEQLVLALSFAAATALSNARLYQESRLQQQWLRASAEVSAQLFGATDEDALVTVGRRTVDLADADLVAIALITPDRRHVQVEVAFGTGADRLIGRTIELATSFAGHAVETGKPTLVRAVDEDPLRSGHVQAVLDTGPLLVIPLRGSGEVRGVLSLARRRGRATFSDAEVAMIDAFASHAVVSIELADARAAEHRLMVLEERDRIARDLHDHVIQELYAVGMQFQRMARELGEDSPLGRRTLARVEDIDRTIRRVRTTIFELHTAEEGAGSGLRECVLNLVGELTPVLGFAPHVVFSGLLDVVVEPELADDVVAVVRESLTNVAKHARAMKASVDVAVSGKMLRVTVTDDGRGVSKSRRHSGTANLDARARRHGGRFEMMPGAAGGTVARWEVPLP